ncbi:MAG: 3-dehydroquinate synthase [Sphingobacterium sp.]
MQQRLEQRFNIEYRYDVYFSEDLFAQVNDLFKNYLSTANAHSFKQKLLFVIDSGVLESHPRLWGQLTNYHLELENIVPIPEPLVIPGGELCKNDPAHLESIIQAVDQHGIDRHSYVVAIGGGAVLDLVGFAATIAHRGLKHIRIPTTVLAQNDSGVGVKNAVNYKGKKNFLGAFNPPQAVFNDYSFLQSLDDRSWLSGISEAIKVALIKDAPFLNWMEENTAQLRDRNSPAMKELIYRCAALHLAHIRNGDPFELGSSRPLDFGHWSAHKLEQMSNFELLHGEAVAIGIAIDVYYSYLIGNIQEQEALRIIRLLDDLGLPTYYSFLDSEETRLILFSGLMDFQEHLGGKLTVVLLQAIGQGKDYHHIDYEMMGHALDYLKEFNQDQSNLYSHASK